MKIQRDLVRRVVTRRAGLRGGSFVITLWMVTVISILVVALVQRVDFGLEAEATRYGHFRARLLAECGLAVARSPLVRPGDPLLRQEIDGGEFATEIISEGGRININFLYRNEDRVVLERLFTSWGLSVSEIEPLIDRIFDWIDPDDLPRNQGAERKDYEREGYPGIPRNREFFSLNELEGVMGFERVVAANPRWRDFFTVWSTGPVDVNAAEAEVLEIVAELNPLQSRRVALFRLGEDGEKDTEDDQKFESLEDFRLFAGIPTRLFEVIQNRLTLSDPLKRLVSRGRIGRYEVTLQVIVQESPEGRRTIGYVD